MKLMQKNILVMVLAANIGWGTEAAVAQADKLTPALAGKPRERVILADRIVAVVNEIGRAHV